MAWWVIALLIWTVASFAAATIVALMARRGRASPAPGPAAERRAAPGRGVGGGRAVPAGVPALRTRTDRGGQIGSSAHRHRR